MGPLSRDTTRETSAPQERKRRIRAGPGKPEGKGPVSIRLIAIDLYRLEREVADLEKRLEICSNAEREEVEDLLRKARAERRRMKDVLEGAKEDPICRQAR